MQLKYKLLTMKMPESISEDLLSTPTTLLLPLDTL